MKLRPMRICGNSGGATQDRRFSTCLRGRPHVRTITLHDDPLCTIGEPDIGGQCVYVRELSSHLTRSAVAACAYTRDRADGNPRAEAWRPEQRPFAFLLRSKDVQAHARPSTAPSTTHGVYSRLAKPPKDLCDSASIDAAPSFVSFRKIVIPIFVPALASVSVFQSPWIWNAWSRWSFSARCRTSHSSPWPSGVR